MPKITLSEFASLSPDEQIAALRDIRVVHAQQQEVVEFPLSAEEVHMLLKVRHMLIRASFENFMLDEAIDAMDRVKIVDDLLHARAPRPTPFEGAPG